MTSRLPGACFRALLIAATVLAPSLLVAGASAQAADTMLLIAIFAAIFVVAEYWAASPGLMEFRDAPPFNRVRYGMLLAMLVLLATVFRDVDAPSAFARLVQAFGLLLGAATDVPGSPVRIVLWLLPEGTDVANVMALRSAMGLASAMAAIGMVAFWAASRAPAWPAPRGGFNVWINLPTFGATSGGDAVRRLRRDGAINIALGAVLPYLAPPLAMAVAMPYDISLFESDLLLVWTISLWAFLPACLILRGVALRRLASMLAAEHDEVRAGERASDLLPA